MAEIIQLTTKTKSVSLTLKNPLSVQILNDFNKNPDIFEELIIFFKKPDGTVGIVDTMPSIEDKSLFLQMLQHQVICYLDRNRVTVTPEMVTQSETGLTELEEDK